MSASNAPVLLTLDGVDLTKLSEAEREELYRLLTAPPETRFATDPVGWAVEVLGVPEWSLRWSLLPEYAGHEWDGTPDPIAAMMEAVAEGERKVAVESATGTGKTYGAAILALWYLATHQDALVITSAPKEDQLTVLLWKEIGRQWKRFQARYPMASTVKLRVRMSPEAAEAETWAIVGWACGTTADEESANRARGFHAEHMLIITEETPGIDMSIMKSFAATCTGSGNIRLALGNPDHQQDTLHQFAKNARLIRASAYDHPNLVLNREVIPGACSWSMVEDAKQEFGEDTPMFNSKVRGICPDQATNALIRAEWVDRAFANYDNPAYHIGKPAMGVDVAQSDTGRDKAAIARGTGAALHEVESFPCDNADELGERVVIEAKTKRVLPKHVGVDAIGVGSNVVNAGKRLGFPVVAIQSAAMAQPERDAVADVEAGLTPVVGVEQYLNLRSQMWWAFAQDLRHNRLAIKRDEGLRQDLLAVTWTPKNGKIVIKPKDLIRKELGRSTDKGDAAVYWNWVRDRSVARTVDEDADPFSPEVLAAQMQVLRTLKGRAGLKKRASTLLLGDVM